MSDIKCKEVLVKLAHGEQLLETELSEFFSAILDEKVKPSQIGAFLMGLERTGLDKAALVAVV